MTLDPALQRRLIQSVVSSIVEHADELSALDRAIGDGDHGLNMKRGVEAVLADLDRIAALPPSEALKAVGTTLVMKVGGASGPLYGTLLMSLGKAWPAAMSRAALAEALGSAVDAVKARGKSDVGAKTMLDVLVPLVAFLRSSEEPLLERTRSCVSDAATATIDMRASRGRASFLGERSVGHADPGARSCELIVHAIVDTLESAARSTEVS